jgi:N-acetylneuraminic acid mutarotase
MKSILRITIINFLSIAFVAIIQSCEKKSTLPEVTTEKVRGITQISAQSGGNVIDDGGAEVTARGIVWATNQNPTTSSDKTSNGTGTGSFTTIINGLTANTTYYIRAYAINSEGTSYGEERDFTTSVPSTGIKKSDFPGGSRSGSTSFSIGSKVYLGLGSGDTYSSPRDFWEWDQATNIWIKKADYPGNSAGGAVGFSIGAKGYIGTGYVISGGVTNEFWEYDPATDTWTEKASLPVSAARAYASGFSIGTKGYIGIGDPTNEWEYTSYFQDFWEWDQATNVWTQKADYGGSGRSSAVGFSIGTKGYIGTGYVTDIVASSSFSRDFWEWDQTTNVWTQKANLGGSGRLLAVGFSIGTKGYIGTGLASDGVLSSYYSKDVWEWDQATNIWTRKADLEGYERYSAVGVSIGDKGYIGTGFGKFDDPFQDFWEYDPK